MGDQIKISISTRVSDALTAVISECSALADAACKSPEIAEQLFRLLESPLQLVRAETEHAAAGGAGDCVVVLQPSDRFLDLLAAMRAGNV